MLSTNLFIGHQLNHREALSRLKYWIEKAQKEDRIGDAHYSLNIAHDIVKLLQEREYYAEPQQHSPSCASE